MKHAELSPSSAKGWASCAWYQKGSGNNRNAAWGTATHEVAAWALINGKPPEDFPQETITVDEWTFDVDDEMLDHCNQYITVVHAIKGPDGLAWYEKSIDIGWLTGEDNATGHSDAIVIRGKRLTVVDLKTGQHKVRADELQLAIYGLGALYQVEEVFDIEELECVIVQTRHGTVDRHVYTMEEVEELKLTIAAAAQRWKTKATKPTPTYAGCQYCARATDCEEYDAFVEAEVKSAGSRESNFEAIDETQGYSLRSRYDNLDLIELYVKKIREEVAKRVGSGDTSLALKYVRGRKGARKWANKEVPLKWAQEKSLNDLIKTTAKSPKQFQDYLLKKAKTPEVWAGIQEWVVESEGKLQLAPVDDPRPAVENRGANFEAMNEEDENE